MNTLLRSWPLLIAVFFGCNSIARAQHMNSAAAPAACRNAVVTLQMEECFDRAYKAADSKLNQEYSQIEKVLNPDELAQLKVAQRLWIQLRDATCKAEGDLYSGGTASTPAYFACLEEETRLRTADLNTTYGWVIANSK
jgi:uncharacterized protein YecT (DUF1311 family)